MTDTKLRWIILSVVLTAALMMFVGGMTYLIIFGE